MIRINCSIIYQMPGLIVACAKINRTNDKRHAKALTGVREGYYKDDEIKNWLKEGEIREFKRWEH